MRVQQEMDVLWIELTEGIDQDMVIRKMKKHKYWPQHEKLSQLLHSESFYQDSGYAQYEYNLVNLRKFYRRILLDSVT